MQHKICTSQSLEVMKKGKGATEEEKGIDVKVKGGAREE